MRLIKTLHQTLRQEKEKFKIPKSVHEVSGHFRRRDRLHRRERGLFLGLRLVPPM